jgi:transcriptional regulator with XRE-family HTH domain
VITETPETLRVRFKAARAASGLTQEDAAAALGVSTASVSRKERGDQPVNMRDVAAMERITADMQKSQGLGTVPRETFGAISGAAIPRDQRIMVTEFELEAEKLGAPEFFMDYARDALRNPDNVTARRYGHDGKVLSVEDQRLKTEQTIQKLRILLEAILRDVRRGK